MQLWINKKKLKIAVNLLLSIPVSIYLTPFSTYYLSLAAIKTGNVSTINERAIITCSPSGISNGNSSTKKIAGAKRKDLPEKSGPLQASNCAHAGLLYLTCSFVGQKHCQGSRKSRKMVRRK